MPANSDRPEGDAADRPGPLARMRAAPRPTALHLRSHQEGIDAVQRDVLEAIALGRPLHGVMDMLCRRIEALAPDVVCSVLAVDEAGKLHPLAAPSLPEAFSRAIDGEAIGPSAGSCGTAAWRRQSVEVQDIATDPLWDDYRALAVAYGLAACWSTPILLDTGRAGATFALYYRESRPVVPFHRRMVETCAQLCSIALKHERDKLQIERLAYYDGVTGLANRSLFFDRAQQALQMSARLATPSAMLLLDIDRFKTVNDSIGHAAGDEVLRQVAQRLGTCVRSSDTLARLGGDEFVVVLPGCSAADAMSAAEKMLASLAPPLAMPGRAPLTLSASIGISTFPQDGTDREQLLKHADIAMYEAKRAGRGCARYFLHSMNQALNERLRLEAALRHALAHDGFTLHYQPAVRMRDGALVGAEALLRWRDPEAGLPATPVFIAVAEECGLVIPIDAWVLETACAQLARWRDAGLDVPGISVNVSPRRFYQDDVAGHVRRLLAEHRIDAHHLTLEVTERLMLDEDARTRAQLHQLHELGVRLSVDDFGTGYSSLSYLKRLPIHEIKLDKSFVHDLESDPDDRAIASAIIGIGKALGLDVVAEGVETPGQQDALLAAGCDVAQGYRFGEPLSAAAFEGWLRARD